MSKVSAPTLIGADEVLTSSELQERLVKQGFTKDAARQAVQRAVKQKKLWRSSQLKFARNDRVVALPQVAGTPLFFERVSTLVESLRPGLARCLQALGEAGILTRLAAHRLLAVPANGNPHGTFPGLASEFSALEELGVQVRREGTAYECLVGRRPPADHDIDGLASDALKQQRVEGLLARVIVERFRRLNVLSWNGSEPPDIGSGQNVVDFNGYLFSASGYSYLRPLTRRQKERPKPCPVVIDVYGGRCLVAHVLSFRERMQRAFRGNSAVPILGVIAAKEFAEEAWKTAKSEGMLTMNTTDEFGDTALNVLVYVEELLKGLSRLGNGIDDDAVVGGFVDSLEALKRNPVVNDLCSLGLEILSGLVLQEEGYHSITVGRNYPFKQTTRDVDVSGERADEPIIVECKALYLKKTVNPSDVRKFYSETVPAFLDDWAKMRSSFPKKCRAEFWTTGRFDKDAKEALEGVKLKTGVEPVVCEFKDIESRLTSRLRERLKKLLRTIAEVGGPPEKN